MTVQSRTLLTDATTPARVDRTSLDRADEERSENEGMRESADKEIDPEGSEKQRTARANETSAKDPLTKPPKAARPKPSETTDLERRVLAHERILQALIAHITETEPKFLARLSERFSEPMQMVRREHDYTDTDPYAEDFIRAVVSLGAEPAGKAVPPVKSEYRRAQTADLPLAEKQLIGSPTRIRIRENGGIWQVTVDGRFYGQYMKEEHALAVARNLA